MDWGLPDWTDLNAYSQTNDWTDNKWRWEFTRRRKDYRDDFDSALDYSVEYYADLYSQSLKRKLGIQNTKMLLPSEPGFSCVTTTQQISKYGIQLLNPRISDQPEHAIAASPNPFRGGMAQGSGEPFGDNSELSLVDGVVGLRIDLDEPIQKQLDGSRSWLFYLQEKRHGKKIQRRKNRDVWPKYLRVLDGRENGASWNKIFEIVLKPEKPNNSNQAQEARGVWESANALMFNWPN